MLNSLAEYASEEAQKKYQVNQEFILSDLFSKEDWEYITKEGKNALAKVFRERISRSVDGIIQLEDKTEEGYFRYRKVADKVSNINYFAQRIY